MEKRRIVLPLDPDGNPVTAQLHARQSSVSETRLKCCFVATFQPGTQLVATDGELGPKVGELVTVQLAEEFRVETTA